jgi:hypothetical protein
LLLCLADLLLLAWTFFLNIHTVIRAAWDPVLPENHQYLNIGEDLFMELSPQYLERYSNAHGLITYKDTKTIGRHLKKIEL